MHIYLWLFLLPIVVIGGGDAPCVIPGTMHPCLVRDEPLPTAAATPKPGPLGGDGWGCVCVVGLCVCVTLRLPAAQQLLTLLPPYCAFPVYPCWAPRDLAAPLPISLPQFSLSLLTSCYSTSWPVIRARDRHYT